MKKEIHKFIKNLVGNAPEITCLTFTAERDSSKLERNPWERKGLYCSGPVASRLHASQPLDGTSKIDDTTETDISLAFSVSAESS